MRCGDGSTSPAVASKGLNLKTEKKTKNKTTKKKQKINNKKKIAKFLAEQKKNVKNAPDNGKNGRENEKELLLNYSCPYPYFLLSFKLQII